MIRGTVPQLKTQPGFRAFSAGINRGTGRGFTVSSWTTPEQREASNQAFAAARQPVIEAGAMYGVQIANFETVIAEVKLPVKA